MVVDGLAGARASAVLGTRACVRGDTARRGTDRAGWVVRAFRCGRLRDTYATLLARKNVNPKVVQDTLGHASLSMTLGIYSHVQAAMKDEAAAAMDSIFP